MSRESDAKVMRAVLLRHPRKLRRDGADDPAFLEWLRKWPCYVCLRAVLSEPLSSTFAFPEVIEDPERRSGFVHFFSSPDRCGRTVAAHIGHRGLRQKSKDREAMPLGVKHHSHQTAGGGPESHHTLGKKFWDHHGLDRETVIAILNRLYHQETGK